MKIEDLRALDNLFLLWSASIVLIISSFPFLPFYKMAWGRAAVVNSPNTSGTRYGDRVAALGCGCPQKIAPNTTGTPFWCWLKESKGGEKCIFSKLNDMHFVEADNLTIACENTENISISTTIYHSTLMHFHPTPEHGFEYRKLWIIQIRIDWLYGNQSSQVSYIAWDLLTWILIG